VDPIGEVSMEQTHVRSSLERNLLHLAHSLLGDVHVDCLAWRIVPLQRGVKCGASSLRDVHEHQAIIPTSDVTLRGTAATIRPHPETCIPEHARRRWRTLEDRDAGL
jgi:hypothetical protein